MRESKLSVLAVALPDPLGTMGIKKAPNDLGRCLSFLAQVARPAMVAHSDDIEQCLGVVTRRGPTRPSDRFGEIGAFTVFEREPFHPKVQLLPWPVPGSDWNEPSMFLNIE